MRKSQTGFSLIELLITVAIILVLAALAIPNLLQSKKVANEASAVASVRLIGGCLVSYRMGSPTLGFPPTLFEIGPEAGRCMDQPLLDASSGGAPKAGYIFSYTPTQFAGFTATGFIVTGAPAECDRTGVKALYADETGVVRFTSDAAADCPPADATSPPLG